MKRLEQPWVLIQRGSYLQRCRSLSVVPVIAMAMLRRQILAPTLATAELSVAFFQCLTIQIV